MGQTICFYLHGQTQKFVFYKKKKNIFKKKAEIALYIRSEIVHAYSLGKPKYSFMKVKLINCRDTSRTTEFEVIHIS